MENAVDALYIAGAILLLLVALTVGISSFSTQIAQIDQIVENDERVNLATDESGSLVNYITYSSEVREVGVETVVNSLYRAYKENYTVYIKLKDGTRSNLNLYKYNEILKTATKEQKYKATTSIINVGDSILCFKITTEYNLQNAKEKMNDIMKEKSDGGVGLYKAIENERFDEYIGEFYQNDIGTGTRDPSIDQVSDANKTKTRIITYIQK